VLGGPSNSKELGFYFALGQVGLEMVAPIVIGWFADHYLGWGPWGVVGGAVLGFIMGLVHLLMMLHRQEKAQSKSRRESS
jgi:F0F1-type ATP synthase assembly protein I